jgi:rubrerythrin
MELGTTGAILSFALKRESEIEAFYTKYKSQVEGSGLKEVFESIHRAQKKRERLLTRFRRENVTEMILEPIHGFESDSYALSLVSEVATDDSALQQIAIRIEESSHSFFLKASEKTTFLPEVSDKFKELSEKAASTIELLKRVSLN